MSAAASAETRNPFGMSDATLARRAAIDALRTVRDQIASWGTEQALVGGMMIGPRATDAAIDAGFSPDMLADDSLRVVARAIVALRDDGKEPTPNTVDAYLGNDEVYVQAGGRAFVADLLSVCPSLTAVPSYAEAVADLARRRAVLDAAAAAAAAASEPPSDKPTAAVLAKLGSDVEAIEEAARRDRPIVSVADAALEVIADAEQAAVNGNRAPGLRTGFEALDRKLRPMGAGQMLILAARPSMGKSAAGFEIGWRAAKAGARVAIFSLEMTAEEVTRRILSGETGIPLGDIMDGRLTDEQWIALSAARERMKGIDLLIDDAAGKTLGAISLRCRSLSRRQPLDLVVVDHIGLVMPPREIMRNGLTQSVEHTSNGMKRLARELRCPVLALCQLNRAVEGREDKMPGLSDLRQSGSLEQDADAVVFLWRDEYYLERQEPVKRGTESDAKFSDRVEEYHAARARAAGKAQLFIAKQRNGPTGSLELRFDKATTRFTDVEEVLHGL